MPMLKLCFIALLGTFIIYGLDEIQVISASDFTYKEKPNSKNSPLSEKFTDHIVQLRQTQKG